MTHFFNKQLLHSPMRISSQDETTIHRLDKNEQSVDVGLKIKSKALDAFIQEEWNRYPSADLSDIETNVAVYCGLSFENIVLDPGSANLITILLNYFALNGKHIVINHPSYSLFEYHCQTYNIPFTPWRLNDELNFDMDTLPDLNENSVLIITSPNNPTGNTISKEELETILYNHPDTLVILDAVYTEFANEDFTPWVKKFQNLIVLRSFSKAFPIPGLRLGYLCAEPKTASVLKKLVLPFSIHTFTLNFAREILFDPEFQMISKHQVNSLCKERDRMKRSIETHFQNSHIRVYPSQGNFLLIRIDQDDLFMEILASLTERGIKVLNTSKVFQLQNTFRVSVGSREENEVFPSCLFDSLRSLTAIPQAPRFNFYPL